LEAYRINIQGLSTNLHRFEFELGKEFFKRYGTDLVSEGNLVANVNLNKHETFIEAEFHIAGTVKLVCDRSLESFDQNIMIDQKIIFKYGVEEKEITEDVIMITHQTESLELGQLMYEFIGLTIPMKKLHPRFQQEDQEGIIFTSGADDDSKETDPRWDVLKKLSKN
jgi:uncharacterized metal-binding protein YceD (DUF177 family)